MTLETKIPEHVEIDLFQNGIIHVQVYSQMFLVMYQQVCTTTKCRYLHPMNPEEICVCV